MNRIKQKLNNNNGVSILFALFLFVVASMVSVTIISAAYSSVKRTHTTKENTQSMLTLDSASLLLKNNMDNVTYTVKKTSDGKGYVNDGSIDTLDNSFETELLKISRDIRDKNISTTSKEIFTVSASNMDDVSVSYFLQASQDDGSYIAIFELKTVDERKTYVKFNVERDETNKEVSVKWNFFRISGKKN